MGKRRRTNVPRTRHDLGFCKFNIDGTASSNPSLAGIGRVIHNDRGRMLMVFLESTGTTESNDGELLAIKKAIHLWVLYGNGSQFMTF